MKNTVPITSIEGGIPGRILRTNTNPSNQMTTSIVLVIQFLWRAAGGLADSLVIIWLLEDLRHRQDVVINSYEMTNATDKYK
jgi:hypothetical protein